MVPQSRSQSNRGLGDNERTMTNVEGRELSLWMSSRIANPYVSLYRSVGYHIILCLLLLLLTIIQYLHCPPTTNDNTLLDVTSERTACPDHEYIVPTYKTVISTTGRWELHEIQNKYDDPDEDYSILIILDFYCGG